MSCTTTTGMYLNVSTDICASASASRSGNTITVSGTFSVSQGNTWNYNAIYAYVDGQTSWTKVKPYKSDGGGYWEASFSFSFTDSNAGTRNYNAIFQVWNNAESGTVGNSASVGFSVSYGAANSAPTGLSVTNIVRGQESFTANVSITGWGVGSGTRYRELQVWTQGMVEPRRYQPAYGDSLSGNITCNNSSNGSLTIVPNTMYTLGIYATNGSVAAGSYNASDYTTLPPTPTISNIGVGATTAEFTYGVPNQGGKYDMTLKYQLDGGSAVTVTTLTGSGVKSGTFTVTGLSSGTTHTITAALSTSAGEVVSNTVTFTTATPSPKLYGSVGEIMSCTGTIRDGAVNVTAFDPTTFISKLKNPPSGANYGPCKYADGEYNEIAYVKVYLVGGYYMLEFYSKNGKHRGAGYGMNSLSGWGITAPSASSATGHTDYIDLTTAYDYKSKGITKLYGSAEKWTMTAIENNNVNMNTFMNKFESTYGPIMYVPNGGESPDKLRVHYYSSRNEHDVYILRWDANTDFLFSYGTVYNDEGLDWGFSSEPVDGNITRNHNTRISKKVLRLYGSVNGQTKLFYDDTAAHTGGGN